MEILIVIGGVVVVVLLVILVGRIVLRSMRPEVPAQSYQSVKPTTLAPTTAAPPAAHPTVVAPETAQEVELLIAQEQPIAAIKLVREQTGLGLAQAKRTVDT